MTDIPMDITDGVEVTPGCGAVVKTEYTPEGHVQIVKLTYSSTDPLSVELPGSQFTGTLGTTDAVIDISTAGRAGTVVFEVSGTWKGKIVVEGAIDGNYVNLSIVQPGGLIAFTGVNNDNMNGIYRALLISAYTHLRLRMSTYTSGTATVIIATAQNVPTPFVWQLNHDNLNGNMWMVDEAGVAYGVKQINNKPRVSSMPYLYDIAEGNVTAHTPFAKLGYNGDVGATEEDIITQGGVYPWIASPISLEIVSSSSDDTLSGSGVQKVRVSGLSSDYSEQSEIISTDGTNPVPLTKTYLRVNSIRATQVGTNMMSVGIINCRLVGGAATVYRQIAAGYTRGRGLTYTVPLGKTLYITSIAVSSGFTTAGKVVRWTGRAQVDDTDPTTKIDFFQPFFEIITQDASFHRDFEMPIKIPATADLKVSAVSNNAGSFCDCALRGWLE